MTRANQPVPKVSDADVARIVARDFGAAERDAASEILGRYGTEKWEMEIARVRLAALKLASGDLEALRKAIAMAKTDYRDALAQAEYPRYMREARPGEAAISADWEQYAEWFSRTTRTRT